MIALRSRSAKRVPTGLTSVVLAALVISFAGSATSASAASGGPVWAIQSVALPTNFSAGDTKGCEEFPGSKCDSYMVTATNTGASPTNGESITVKDQLPPGIVIEGIGKAEVREPGGPQPGGHDEFEILVQCSAEPGSSSVTCTTLTEGSHPVPPGGVIFIEIEVIVTGSGAASVTNIAEVEGGGAAPVATSEPSTVANTVNGEAPSFGVQDFSVGVYGPSGRSDAQAGDHPGALTTTLDYTTKSDFHEAVHEGRDLFDPVQDPKTEIVDLPLGFVGDPLATEQCPESTLSGTETEGHKPCPADSQVGVVEIESEKAVKLAKIYNVVTEPGYPALFGFELLGASVYLRSRVLPTSSGYVLGVSVPDIQRSVQENVTGAMLTFFGDPAEQDGGSSSSPALFTNPTDCSSPPLKARVEMDSWVNPQQWVAKEASMYEASATQALSGCNLLAFNPTIEVAPEETQADTPSGYEVDLKVPQTANLSPDLATPDLRNAEVTLPEGVSVSPSAADGLVGCQESGPEGIELGNHDALGHEVQEGEELGPDGLPHAAAGHCPKASQLGTVEVTTPLLREKLEGHVYLAQPKCGGEGQPACTEASATNGELFGLYLEAAGSGVIVKLKGTVSVNPQTGRITTRFDENPQLPFSELKLELNGGPRAPLANPQTCGQATTTSVLEPWSAPESGPPATPFSSFAVTGCASSTPFSPAFSAGTVTPLAGAFSPFTLSFSRSDGQQDLSGLTVQTPPGLLGMLSAVQLCPEPQASQGTCGPQSLIGHTLVAAGAGSHPFSNPGTVYLTGPYKGQPFGLSIVTPAKAGPFNLGNVIVRASIHVDPHTSALTVTSDPLPQIIDGVPLRIQTVNVTIDKPNFMFNPTNCAQQQITATITAAQGAVANVATPFAASGCKNLPFKPDFSASTTGKTSKALGASLHVKIASAGLGQANIAKVDVELPKALPTQLKTLNKACTEAQFNSNPANCPPASDVAQATVHTPLLNSPLTGPAYLVSHGNAAFPDVEMVLQGEGVELVLDGKTQIKQGITYSHFETVPDAPFTSFEFNSPQGELALFAANGDLCDQKLVMPVTLTGQNGAVLKQNTPVEVEGCSNSLSVISSKVKKKTLTLSVYAPAAGKVTASGKGISTGAKTYSGREALTFTLKQKQAGKLKTKIKLTFTPKSGKKQAKSLTVKFKK
jgi:hypothetical protein